MSVVRNLADCLEGEIAPSVNISEVEKQRTEEEAIRNIAAILRRASGGRDPGELARLESLLMKLFHEYVERTIPWPTAIWIRWI